MERINALHTPKAGTENHLEFRKNQRLHCYAYYHINQSAKQVKPRGFFGIRNYFYKGIFYLLIQILNPKFNKNNSVLLQKHYDKNHLFA